MKRKILLAYLAILLAFLLPNSPKSLTPHAGSLQPKPIAKIEPYKGSVLDSFDLLGYVSTEPVKSEPAPTGGCDTGNKYKDFIYFKESGCDPSAVNSIGCRGIGQACPGSKLPCGADFACQDAWFSNYAVERYGSWEQSYYFWTDHHWW